MFLRDPQTEVKEISHEEDAPVHRLRHGRRPRAARRLQWAGRPGPEAQVRGREVLRGREGGQERLPDGQLVLRRHLAPRRPEGRLALRAGGRLRATGQRQPAAPRRDDAWRGAPLPCPAPARRRAPAGGVRDRAAGAARRGDPRVAAGAAVGRGAPGELHGRGPRRRAARGGAPGLPRLAPRRRALARQRRGARRATPRTAPGAGRSRRAVPGLRASVLERRGRRLSEPPAAAAVHGGDARRRRGARRSGAGRARTSDPDRESVELSALSPLDDRGARAPRGAGGPHRMRIALRRQQRLRERAQPRARSGRLPRRAARGCGGGDPPRRSRGERRRRARHPDRRPRLARGRAGLGPLCTRARALRRGADADRVGYRHSRARRPDGRGGGGRSPDRLRDASIASAIATEKRNAHAA